MAVKTYRYGCRKPLDDVLPHIHAGHRYRNKLVEIELDRRSQTDAYLLANCSELVACESRLADADKAIESMVSSHKRSNADARGKTQTKSDKDALKALRANRKQLYAARKELRTNLFADGSIKSGLAAINSESAAAVRAARAVCGVYWGTYLLIEDSASQFRAGAPPKFERWRGEGRIGVQIQGGMTWESLRDAKDTRLRLTPAPTRVIDNGTNLPIAGEKTQSKRWILWMRIGSNGRSPVWAQVPVIIHRDPPANSRIKWCVLHRSLVAGKAQWYVTFSIENHATAFTPRDVATEGSVGVDIGYRVMPDGNQRVAVAYGSDGRQHELYLPKDKVSEWERVDRIQGYRDDAMNGAKSLLNAWLEANPGSPAWLKERCKHLQQWRSARRLDDLVMEWSQTAGVTNDSEIIAALIEWRLRERHLWSYQENLRQQLLAWRKNHYREWCAMLRKSYRTVYIEKMDLRDAIHDTLVPEEERTTVTAQRRTANRAALSTLVSCLSQCGLNAVKVQPQFTTTDCCECNHRNTFDDETALMQECEGCGRVFDQDENAARNILSRGESQREMYESLAIDVAIDIASTSPAKTAMRRRDRMAASRKNALDISNASGL